MDDRRLTFIVVPHGDLETKTFEITYRRLRLLALLGGASLCGLLLMVAFWWSIAAQAARVRGLEQQLSGFEEDRAKVDSLAHLLAEVEADYEMVRQMLGADAPANGQRPALPDLRRTAAASPEGPVIDAWPLAEAGYITRGLTADGNHPGLDIAVPQSSYIRAAGPGTVIASAEDSVYGKFIRIEHGSGLETLYGHASLLLVKKGDRVKRQQVIALSGNTGRSTAPHLHFEVRENGTPVDPTRFVKRP